jgi:sugar phosphate isomerase/epimerase
MVQHLGVSGEEYDDHKVEAAFIALEELSSFARQRGVEVLLENTQNSLATAERLAAFLAQTHLKLGFCFDAGHANLHRGIEHEFRIMESGIRSTHLHDNDGKADQHLFPLVAGGGTIDWSKTMGLLGSHPDQYPLLLELKEVPEYGTHPLNKVKEIFERLESLSCPTP